MTRTKEYKREGGGDNFEISRLLEQNSKQYCILHHISWFTNKDFHYCLFKDYTSILKLRISLRYYMPLFLSSVEVWAVAIFW